jgi:hypothetical protein
VAFSEKLDFRIRNMKFGLQRLEKLIENAKLGEKKAYSEKK